MKALLLFIALCFLLALSWPIALAALLLLPLVWLISLPFRLLDLSLAAVLALLRAILMLPARLLGQRG